MGRKTINGIRMNRIISEAEYQAIRRSGDLDKQYLKAKELGVLDEDWYNKTLRILRHISRDII